MIGGRNSFNVWHSKLAEWVELEVCNLNTDDIIKHGS